MESWFKRKVKTQIIITDEETQKTEDGYFYSYSAINSIIIIIISNNNSKPPGSLVASMCASCACDP